MKFFVFSSFFFLFAAVVSASVKRKLKSDDGGSNDVNPDECARTVPKLILDVLDLGEDWGYLLGQQDGDWSSVCCTASALRAETGALWSEPPICTPYINTGIPYFVGTDPFRRRMGGTDDRKLFEDETDPEPQLEFDPFILPNWLYPTFEVMETTTIGMARRNMRETEDDRTRRLKQLLSGPQAEAMQASLKEADEYAKSVFKPDVDFRETIVKFLAQIAKSNQAPSPSDQETEEGTHRRLDGVDGFDVNPIILTETCPALFEDPREVNLKNFFDLSLLISIAADLEAGGPIGDLLLSDLGFLLCNGIKENLALLALYLFSPWLLPACHCKYRKDGCGISSCYDTCTEDCEEGPVYTPKVDLISDVQTAVNSYWRAQLYQTTPFGAGGYNGLLRACQACPGEATYFEGRLFEFNEAVDVIEDFVEGGSGISFDLDTYNGLFPVRRGGKPFDECLGMCYMYGLIEEPLDCEPVVP